MIRPILFSAPMVRAILEGRKTQTRRVVDLDRLYGFLPRSVRGDSIFSSIVAEPGKHRLHTNRNFAVSAILPEEKKLGLRPGEFDFVCPYAGQCSAETDGKIWTLTPREPARLWVRETWQSLCEHDALAPAAIPEGSGIQYPATYDGWASKHRPSIHMCRWMARILLEVTEVRIERLQDISEEDARAEGCGGHPVGAARGWFHDLWDRINGPQSWGENPWVWAVSFRRIEA